MNNDERRKINESVRAPVLRHNAADQTHGVYLYARSAAASRKIADMVFELAHTVAKNEPLTINERMFLVSLLKALSCGDDVREQLRIDHRKVGHNPSQAILNSYIVREIEQRIADGQRSGDALFAEVARIAGKPSAGAVRQIWQRAKRKGGHKQ